MIPIDEILTMMVLWYDKMKRTSYCSINISNIEQWVINKIKAFDSYESIYLLPEPYSVKLTNGSDIEDIINKYFNSVKFNTFNIYTDMFDPIIQIEINPMIWVSITQYEIIQIIEINIS